MQCNHKQYVCQFSDKMVRTKYRYWRNSRMSTSYLYMYTHTAFNDSLISITSKDCVEQEQI